MNIKEVADKLQQLEQENGQLDPVAVVESARDPNSPMHSFFEWDDTEAARQYRLGQARQLIRRIKVEVTVRDVPLQVVRYVRDSSDQSNGYRNILRVRDDVDIARDALLDEMMRVEKAARRARAVAAVLGTAADVEQIIAIANGVRQQASITDQPAGAA